MNSGEMDGALHKINMLQNDLMRRTPIATQGMDSIDHIILFIKIFKSSIYRRVIWSVQSISTEVLSLGNLGVRNQGNCDVCFHF